MKANYPPIYAICYGGKIITSDFCRGARRGLYRTKGQSDRAYKIIKEEKSNYFYHDFDIDKLEIVEYGRKNETF